MSGLNAMTGEITQVAVTPLAQAEQRIALLEADKRMLVEDLLAKDRTIAGLRSQLASQVAENPHQQVMKAIARYYAARLKKTKAWKFGEKRQKALLARLNEDTDPVRICRGIDWVAEHAYVSPENGKRHDDLELVCRNEVNVEKYWELAEKNNVRTMLDADWLGQLGAPDHPILQASEKDPTTRSGEQDAPQFFETDFDHTHN